MSTERNKPLVSIIVPTKNSGRFLDRCLASVAAQTYPRIELIVVDNYSTDETRKTARHYTEKIYRCGPERSSQVNYGIDKATGEYVYKVDSDFVLQPDVVEQCMQKIGEGFGAVVVHNSPDPTVSWIARIREFEVDMYKYDITHSSARFLSKDTFYMIGGFREDITAGEDYDFQDRLNRAGVRTGFVDAIALHLGEPTHFWPHMKKYFLYGMDFVNYYSASQSDSSNKLSFVRTIYLRNWRKFLRRPFTGIIFVVYHIAKYTAGGAGFTAAKINRARRGTNR